MNAAPPRVAERPGLTDSPHQPTLAPHGPSVSAAAVLTELVGEIQSTLGRDLVGSYVYGSYVAGGFDPGVSDLDLIVVTSPEVEQLDLRGLERMHHRLASRHPGWRDRIEVAYIGRETLGCFRTSRGRLAVISPGEPFHVRDEPVAEWIQNWYLVRESGTRLRGAPIETVVPEVAWPEFYAAAVHYADQIASQDLGDATPGAVAYRLLTMCRAWMTVAADRIGSKQEAAEWARGRLPGQEWLIDRALSWRLSNPREALHPDTRAAAADLIARIATEIRPSAQDRRSRSRAPASRLTDPSDVDT